MRGKAEQTGDAKQETVSVTGVRVGEYVLEVGADCRSFSRFAPNPEKENARALADALKTSDREDVSAPVAALEELNESAADVTNKIEHARALFRNVLTGRFDRGDVMREIDGLLGLSERLDRAGRYEEQIRLARALHGLLTTMFRWLDLLRTLRRALRSAKAVNDQAGQAWALHELGTLHLSAGDEETAERLLREALRVERRLDAVGSCTTRHNLDFCTRGRFVRRAVVVKVVAALVAFTFVIAAAGVLAGAAVSGDEHAATPSLGPGGSFGALPVGETSAPQTISLEAGAVALRVGRITVDDPREFLVQSSCTTVEPGDPCPIEVRFRPAAPGERASELRVALEGVGILHAKLTGVGMRVVVADLDHDSLDLGEAEVGTATAAKTVTLHAGSKPLRVASIASDSIEFSVEHECSETIEASESCAIDVSFVPTSPGAKAATLTVTSKDGGVLESELRGTGVENQPEEQNPPVLDDFLDLGEVDVGERSSEQTLTLTAGSTPLTVAAAESNSPEFQVAEPCRGTLEAHESCAIEVVFGPTAEGRRRGTLEVSTANGRVLTSELRGTGVAPTEDQPGQLPTLTSSRDLGQATVGTRLSGRPLVLTAGSEELGGIAVASDSSEFVVEAHCPTLAAATSCQIEVVFAPAGTGTRKATLTVRAEGHEPLTSQLTGTGVLVELPRLRRFIDFGGVDVGLRSPIRKLTLIAGSEPLMIRRIASNSTEFPVKEHCPQTLDPRERCVIQVAFAPASPEVRSAELTVTQDGGRALTSVLRGTGLTPPRLDRSVDLGEVDLGRSSGAETLTLTAGSRPLTVTGVASDQPGEFRVTSRCAQEVAAGTSCSIDVVFEPAAEGSRSANLEVAVAGREPMRSQLTGTGIVPPTIRSTLDFGQVAVEAREQRAVRLTAGSKPLTVTRTQTDDQRQFIVSNTCEGRLAPRESCDITVLFRPLAAESHSARLTVAFSDRPGLEVRLTGVGIEGFIKLDPEKLDFGSFSSISRTLEVTLTNTGPASLTIRSITSSAGPFSVSSQCPAVLAAGRSCRFWVTLTPPDFGTYTAWITIDADGGGQHRLFAAGTAIQSPIR